MKVKYPAVSPHDMWILLLSTIRYSMGRHTYISGLSVELVVRYNNYLTKQQLNQIADEIEKEIKLHEAMGCTLGADIDHKSWKDCLIIIRDLYLSRND